MYSDALSQQSVEESIKTMLAQQKASMLGVYNYAEEIHKAMLAQQENSCFDKLSIDKLTKRIENIKSSEFNYCEV